MIKQILFKKRLGITAPFSGTVSCCRGLKSSVLNQLTITTITINRSTKAWFPTNKLKLHGAKIKEIIPVGYSR